MTIHKIPKHGGAGIAFAGVTLSEATPLIVSVFAGLFAGQYFGWMGYIGVPMIGYGMSKAYVEWKKGRLPGHLQVLFYINGIGAFSRAFDRKNKIFIGNSVVINPGSGEMIENALLFGAAKEVK